MGTFTELYVTMKRLKLQVEFKVCVPAHIKDCLKSVKSVSATCYVIELKMLSFVCAQCCTFLPKDPVFVHAVDEEDGRLRETHEEVCDCQINNENVGWCPQASAPAYKHKAVMLNELGINKSQHILLSERYAKVTVGHSFKSVT